jgi:hypothetical protein
VYFTLWGIKAWLDDSEDEDTMIRNLGLDYPPPTLQQRQDAEIRRFANSCTSDRCQTPGPVGEHARQLLGRDDFTLRMAKRDPDNWKPNEYGGYEWVGKGPRPTPFAEFGQMSKPPAVDDMKTVPGEKLTLQDRMIIEKYRPGLANRKLSEDDRGELERAVKKLDPDSTLAKAFAKDKATCGGCH